MSYRRGWVLVVILHWFSWPLTAACPVACHCKWKGGKQTVECIEKNLITIPDGVDPGTQVLDFSGNNLDMLPRERFQRMGLLNLQKIYLARCHIDTIDNRAFRGLTNLVELDLSKNLLREIPTETFSDYSSLMRLVLNENPIKSLKTASFLHLSFLTSLEISECEIESIEDDTFAGLDHLEWLKLDGNRLKNIQGFKILPEHLHGVNLQNNPWLCDCRLMDLRTWLINNKIPQSFEPACEGPPRLKGHSIKTLDINDLACLPDVTPTTLYLEIAEGKNVSLLCRVSAVPEARVTWWFQGRILQNDSMIAPGIHLYYFVEEGVEEKKSELFLFNTNTEDNGTFVCVAENPAGKSQSNYTIRIIVKEEAVAGITSFPFEYVITISAVMSILALVVTIAIVLCIVRCRRQRRRRRKKDRSKTVALQSQQHGKSLNMNQIRVDAEPLCPIKINGTLVTERHHNEMILVPTGGNVDNIQPGLAFHPYVSPPSLRNFQLEQNPDLINDTESVGKERHSSSRRGDGDGGEDDERENSGTNSYQEAMENIIHDYEPGVKTQHEVQWVVDSNQKYPLHMSTLPRGCIREVFQHHLTADVHLSPGRFLDMDGYPIDYGLPKPPNHLPIAPLQAPMLTDQALFYRTLPHRPRRESAVTPSTRYSREAEFLARSSQPPSYEHYSPSDVRYTVEGYPCGEPHQSFYSVEASGSFPDDSFLPSPPAAYKGDPSANIVDATSPWEGGRIYHEQPSSNKLVESVSAQGCGEQNPGRKHRPPNQVGEQTIISKLTPTPNHPNLNHPQVVTESPDEGYGGDGTEGTEI